MQSWPGKGIRGARWALEQQSNRIKEQKQPQWQAKRVEAVGENAPTIGGQGDAQ